MTSRRRGLALPVCTRSCPRTLAERETETTTLSICACERPPTPLISSDSDREPQASPDFHCVFPKETQVESSVRPRHEDAARAGDLPCRADKFDFHNSLKEGDPAGRVRSRASCHITRSREEEALKNARPIVMKIITVGVGLDVASWEDDRQALSFLRQLSPGSHPLRMCSLSRSVSASSFFASADGASHGLPLGILSWGAKIVASRP